MDIEEADVTWYFNDIEIIKGYPDWFDHMRMEDDGRERRLVISDCPLAAGGKFTAKTNQDETECILVRNLSRVVKLQVLILCRAHVVASLRDHWNKYKKGP